MSGHERPIKKVPPYHGHPNYLGIFLTLIVCMVATIVLGFFEKYTAALLLVWAIAVFKAYLVMFKFMHATWEPRMVFGWIALAVASLCIFIAGTYSDVILPKHDIKIFGMQPNTPGFAEITVYPKGWGDPTYEEWKASQGGHSSSHDKGHH